MSNYRTTIVVNARFLTQPLTGVQRYAFECCRQMKQLYSNILFVSPDHIRHHQWANELQVQVLKGGSGHYWEQVSLPKYLRTLQPLVLLNLCNTAPLFFRPFVLTLHDIRFVQANSGQTAPFRFWYRFLIPRLLKRAAHIFTVSETMRSAICRQYAIHIDRISVTYNGISDSLLQYKIEPPPPREPVILAVASHAKHKNLNRLIDAFLHSSFVHSHRLVCIGSKSSVFTSTSLPHHPTITFTEEVSDEELANWYQRASCFVSLSSDEGFGLPVLEALVFGCEVLCSDIPVYRELFSGYVTFCDVDNQHDIISALQHVLQQKASLSANAPLREKFNFARSANHILHQVKQVTGS